jgi:signal transduction histidine kinase
MKNKLQWKFVLIMLLLILILMTVVSVFLIQGVQRFYSNAFFSQMETVFTDKLLYGELTAALYEEDPVAKIQEVLDAYQGRLGINTDTRNYYILDGTAGSVLVTSAVGEAGQLAITPNILQALTGSFAFGGNATADYMDIAVPVTGEGDSIEYVVYIRDNRQTVRDLTLSLVSLIMEAVGVGFVIAVALALILAKTLLQPILGMTKAAEAIAGGDFSKKLSVESDDEIGILAHTFNNMASQLQATLEEIRRSEALRREFVANVSHELRTPLTSIRSYAETLTENPDMEKETEVSFLHVILNESDRMTKIVQDLLELSRFDAGNVQFNFERFSISKSIEDVRDAVRLEAASRGHTISVTIPEGLPHIVGDRARIEQVLINIVSNAIKYTPDGGYIDITSGSGDGHVWVAIQDTGIGIPEEDIPRLFDRFYRVDKARSRESGGTGLGLSIALEIIQRHGGDVDVTSVVGEGTTVTVRLPIEPKAADGEKSAGGRHHALEE